MRKTKQYSPFESAWQYVGSSGVATLCKELADEWFEKYVRAGSVTPELEAQRDRIMRLMLRPEKQRS